VQIKRVVRDRSLAFSAAIAGMRNATEAAETIFPETRKLSELLDVTATEVSKAIDGVLSELQVRIDAVLAGSAAPELTQSLTRSAETLQISNRVQGLPETPTKEEESAEGQMQHSSSVEVQ
jgi:hypothetical protein